MNKRIRDHLFQALSLVLLGAAIRNWVVTAKELRRFYTNVHIWDAFDWLAHYARYRQFDISVLWLQHNEHREIGTELLFAIDMLLFHGRQLLPTLAGIAAYVGAVALFVWFSYRESEEVWTVTCGSLMVAAIAGYKLCAVSLTIPFLTSWPQWEFFGAAAMAALALRKIPLAILCAVAATYSMSNGMLVWPLLVLGAWLLRMPRREVAAIIVSGMAAIAAYFYHYQNLHTFTVAAAVQHPLYLLAFLGNFLGMPFSAAFGFTQPPLARWCGWLALLIAAVDLAWIVRRRLWASPAVILTAGFSALVLASTLLTAVGRMNPDDPYYQAARAGRYITEPILFWCALIMLSVWLFRHVWKGYAALVFLMGIGVLAVRTLPLSTDYYAWWEGYFQKGQWAAIALGNGVVDREVADVLFPGPEFVAAQRHVLVDNHLALFADPEPGWIGRKASELFERGPDFWSSGAITTVQKRGADYEVQGWADSAVRVVFTGEDGRVIGFGKRPKAGPVKLYTYDLPYTMAFTGFVRGEFGAHRFKTWALDRRARRMFLLGSPEGVSLPY